MENAYVCYALRPPFGRYGGVLARMRTDDLAVVPLRALMQRNQRVEWSTLDDVIYGCANQAGEDNRNVARMAALLADLPDSVPGVTVNRLCGSGLEAVGTAARAIKSGEASLVIAGGVENMSRAPFVMAKAAVPFPREAKLEDTTLGWRFVNPLMVTKYGTDSLPETAEILAKQFSVSRMAQDAFAFRSQQRAAAAIRAGHFTRELVPVEIPQKNGTIQLVAEDEHPRPDTTMQSLAKLRPILKGNGPVTAGNSSGINDGACALLIASEAAAKRYDLNPLARVVAVASAGVPPRIMGIGPVPASRKALALAGLTLAQMDLIEIN